MNQEFFKITRGNPNKLEGLAVVWGKVIAPHRKETTYTGLHVSIDITRLWNREKNKEFREELKKYPEIDPDEIPDSSEPKEDPQGEISYASKEIKVATLEEIMSLEGDVINTGNFKRPGLAQKVYELVGNAYILKYADQYRTPRGSRKSSDLEIREDLTVLNARQLSKKLYQLSLGITDKCRVNKETLVAFASKTGLQEVVEQLITAAENRKDPTLKEQVKGYAELIAAIRGEEYERAASLRDKIKELKDKPT